jgi:hypothetical protein
MHPFPPATGLQFLVGEVMGQIALDPYSIQLRFADGGQISVEGRLEHVDGTGQAHSYNCQASDGTAIYLHQLLQHRIVTVEVEPFCLTMIFDDGARLLIFSEVGPYECGHISTRDNRMIVF